MIELEQALARVLALTPVLSTESVPLFEAVGRVLSDDVCATIALPPFDNSAMDGFAVRSADLGSPSPACPMSLKLIGRVAAGDRFVGHLSAGECIRVFTGSPVPDGADAVVMQEDTQSDARHPDQVLFLDKAAPGENIRRAGEDVVRHQPIGEKGQSLSATRAALMSATGIGRASVYRRPWVGILSTGNELVEPGQHLAPGQIYESNRLCLAALVAAAGGHPKTYPLVRDELPATRAALADALATCDAVITSGGVSVGELDLVKAAFESLGGELDFWKVAVRPGKPFVLGQWREQKLLFGLPGNPVSAFVTFLLLVRPALRRMQGALQTGLLTLPGVLAEPIANRGDRRHFLRVARSHTGEVRLAGPQSSHMLQCLTNANGLVELAANANCPAGAAVQVLTWEAN